MSYGTFAPCFTVDSDYLQSLLRGKGQSYELVESASIQSSGEFFPSPPTRSSETQPEPPSFQKHHSIESGYFTSPPSNLNFLSECRTQLDKLNSYMEQQLTIVERDLIALKQNMSNKVSTNPRAPSYRSATVNNEFPNSDDSGMAEDDEATVTLLGNGTGGDNYVEVSVGVLNRLRKVLLGLERSLTSSFAALDQLVTQHDNQTMTRDGRDLMLSQSHVRQAHERRLNKCLENVDTELNRLQRNESIKIDGLGHVRSYDEQEILMNVEISQKRSCLPLFVAVLFFIILGIISFMSFWDKNPPTWTVYLRFLRGPLLLLFCIYLFGINIRTWAVSNICYISIFKYNPKGVPTSSYMFKVACIFTTFFTVLIVALLVTSPFTTHYIGNIVPLLMWLSLFVFLFNPLNILLRRARFSFIFVCVRILLAPFTKVEFGDFFLADQLNSTVGILLDMQYLLCYSFIGPWTGPLDEKICTTSGNGIRPIISCLPALWRFLQCFRVYYDTRDKAQLINAGKYFTTFPVVVFATLFAVRVKSNTFNLAHLDLNSVGWVIILWLLSSLVHAIYTFVWDIHCDWGLWNFSKGTFFRPTLIYHHKIVYLLAMVLDLILRFLWTLKLTLAIVWHLDSDLIYTALVIAEILRRFVWNFFRVEYAHVLNQEKQEQEDDQVEEQ